MPIIEEVAAISVEEAYTTLDIQIEKLAEIVQENPEDITVLLAYAELNLRRGRYLEALQAYHRIMNIKPDVIDVHVGLSRIYLRQNMIAEAFNEIVKVFQLSPADIEGRIMYDRLLDIGEPSAETQDAIRNLMVTDPEFDDLRLFKHQKELERERLEGEIAQFEKIMEEHDEEPIYEYNFEMALNRKKNIDELFKYIDALESYLEQKALEIKPDIIPPAAEEAAEEPAEPAEEPAEGAEEPAEPAEEDELPGEEISEENAETSVVEEAAEEVHEAEEVHQVEFPPQEGQLVEDSSTVIFPDEAQVPVEEEQNEIAPDEQEERAAPPALSVEEEESPAGESEVTEAVSEEVQHVEEEAAAVEEEEVIEEPPPPEPVKEGPSEERLQFYQQVKDSITTVLAGLIKTKGVTVAMTVAGDGYVVDSIVNETIDYAQIGKKISSGIEVIRHWRDEVKGKSFLYWVLEFEQGLVVVRAINREYFLVAIAKAGANFGAMRYSMDKGKETLDEILSSAPSDSVSAD
ncbi:MAG: hypothetical protein AB2L14_08165 [Candidatus Xenobiia bacterium LiM19]